MDKLYGILEGLEDMVLWPRMKLRACDIIKMRKLKSAGEQIELLQTRIVDSAH